MGVVEAEKGRIALILLNSGTPHPIVEARLEGISNRVLVSGFLSFLQNDPRLGVRTPTLWELRGADLSNYSLDAFRGLSFAMHDFPDRVGTKRGYLVEEKDFPIVRMYQGSVAGYALEDEACMRISSSRDELIAWLSE